MEISLMSISLILIVDLEDFALMLPCQHIATLKNFKLMIWCIESIACTGLILTNNFIYNTCSGAV